MKKYDVYFEGGEPRDAFKKCHGVNYMWVTGSFCGEEFELYSEVCVDDCPGFGEFWNNLELKYDDISDYDISDFMPIFDKWSYPLLKDDILKQAKSQGLPLELFSFDE